MPGWVPGCGDRRRRRQPDHLFVHRRHPQFLLDSPGASGCHRRAAGTRLPVHPGGGGWPTGSSRNARGPGRRQPAAPGRPPRDCPGRRCSASTPTRGGRGRRGGLLDPQARRLRDAGCRDRRAVPDQRSPRSTRRRSPRPGCAFQVRGGEVSSAARRSGRRCWRCSAPNRSGAELPAAVPRELLEPLVPDRAAADGHPARERWGGPTRWPIWSTEGTGPRRPELDPAGLVAELGCGADARIRRWRGVTLASLHAAKGLEWDAVFLVVFDRRHPRHQSRAGARSRQRGRRGERLLYVGITRARCIWRSAGLARAPGGRRGRKPSRFLSG